MTESHSPCSSNSVKPPKDWVNIFFLTLTPVLAIPVLIWHTWHSGFHLWMPILFGIMYILTGLSICAGYHRYYSHKSYECAWPVQLFYAVFGAMAMQNSILSWCAGHRRHHAYAESDWDPYSIQRGFWWAHIIWIFNDNSATVKSDNVRELQKDPIVAWQHRWYKFIGLAAGLGIPARWDWIGVFGNPLAGLLWGGFLRIVLVHHSTFSVNSLAHRFGSKAYDDESTARDNWAVALLTFGEGYHSFHHRFPADFRNGIRWFNWDPSKWFINALKWTGLASNLRSTAASTGDRTDTHGSRRQTARRPHRERGSRAGARRYSFASRRRAKRSKRRWSIGAARRKRARTKIRRSTRKPAAAIGNF